MIRIGGSRRTIGYARAPKGFITAAVISRGPVKWRELSPFYLPVDWETKNGTATSVENMWQGSKVYYTTVKNKTGTWTQNSECHAIEDSEIGWILTRAYYRWRRRLFAHNQAIRRPNGTVAKGGVPIFSLWGDERLDYIEARKKIYEPTYKTAAAKTQAYAELLDLHKSGHNIMLIDVDGPDPVQYPNGIEVTLESIDKARENRRVVWGHSMVLAKMLYSGVEPE